MPAVMSVRDPYRMVRKGVVLACSSHVLGAAQAQTTLFNSPLDQLESLLREQQSLQALQTNQLQALRQQLDDHAQLSSMQDMQWLGSLGLLIIVLLVLVWLSSRRVTWQMAWAARKERRAAQRKMTMHAPAQRHTPWHEDAEQIRGGSQIDHSGSGILAHVLRRRKAKQAKPAHPVLPSWKASIEDVDSQTLADEAVLEYELRKTVGLEEPETSALNTASQETAAMPISSADAQSLLADTAWQAMQEVPLNATMVDVGSEVQRIRSNLRLRREERQLTTVTAAEFNEPAVSSTSCIEPSQPVESPSKAAPAEPETVLFSMSSMPSATEAETRLALGYEFQKLGQLDEASLLYEEVLVIGSAVDQFRARQLLSALPGR